MQSRVAHDTLAPDIETSGDQYHRRFSGAVGGYLLGTQAQGVIRLIAEVSREPLRILEVGGGHGQLAPVLLEKGHEVCIQGSAPSCRRRIAPLMDRSDGRLRFVTSSLWSLPFGAGSFDLVIAVRVLSHVERWEALLEELARVARTALIIDYASLASVNIMTPALFGIKRLIEGNTRPYFCYRTGRLVRFLRTLGFGPHRTYKQFLVPMGVHRMLKRPKASAWIEGLGRSVGLTGLFGAPVLLLMQRN